MDRDALVARCGSKYRDTTNALVTADEWADYVNDAYMDVLIDSLSWEPPATFLETRATTTVTSTGEAALADDVWRILEVFDATNRCPLDRIDGRGSYRRFYPDTDLVTGTPEVYRLRANTIELYPRPATDVTLSISYFLAPTELGATDEPVFAEAYHRILVAGALAYAYEDDAQGDFAAAQRARFQDGLARLRIASTSSGGERYFCLEDDCG